MSTEVRTNKIFNNKSRGNNILKTSSAGMICMVLSTLIGFIYRTVFIYVLSANYLGVEGLFSNILKLLSMAELGITTAIVYRFYKPISENDVEKVGQLLRFFKRVYGIIATTIMEIYCDTQIYNQGTVNIIEIMGRNAGWLTAAAALANHMGAGADLIFLPEVEFDMDEFLNKIAEKFKNNGKVIVAVSEGIKDKNGKYISEYGADIAQSKDAFGHSQMGGLAAYLTQRVKEHLNTTKVRGIELSLLQRCAGHCASQTDIDESYMSGAAAVENAVNGITDKMVGFEREYVNGEYTCKTKLFDLSVVANAEKKIPFEWMNETKDGLNEKFVEYALPLIQGQTKQPTENSLPRFAKLKRVLVEKK